MISIFTRVVASLPRENFIPLCGNTSHSQPLKIVNLPSATHDTRSCCLLPSICSHNLWHITKPKFSISTIHHHSRSICPVQASLTSIWNIILGSATLLGKPDAVRQWTNAAKKLSVSSILASAASIAGCLSHKLIVYNTTKQVSQLQWLDPRATGPVPDDFTLVIRIDGACRGNGTPGARAAWAVYLGPGSRYNASGLLRLALPQTSSRAEIEALVQALRIVRDITKDDFRLQQVRILSDSEYLVNAMGRWIPRWIEAGGRRSNGLPVAHYQVLKEIHEKLDDMTYGDDGGLDFKFWHISREKNREADALANQALNAWVGALIII